MLVFFIGPPAPSPRWAAIEAGARRHAQHLPYMRVEARQPPSGSAAALSEIVSYALTKKPFAICMYVTDPAAVLPAARRITQENLILITLGQRIDLPEVFAHVQPTMANGAEQLGNRLVEIAGGKRTYLLLHESGKDQLATQCYRRFTAAAGRQQTLTLLEQQNAYGSELTQRQLVEGMLRRFRHAGLVVTLNPQPWLSDRAERVLPAESRFATLGAFPQLWPHLRSGKAAALVGVLDGEIGYAAIDMVAAALTKSHRFGTVRAVRAELVTAETLDDFARRYAEAAGMDLPPPATRASGTQPRSESGGR